MHFTLMLKGSGSITSEQNLFKICLWQFPGWAPQFPHWASFTNSGWSAPSCKAKFASSLTMTAERLPEAQRWSSLLANGDSCFSKPSAFSKAVAFSKAFLPFMAFLPDSCSSCQPLSLLAIAFPSLKSTTNKYTKGIQASSSWSQIAKACMFFMIAAAVPHLPYSPSEHSFFLQVSLYNMPPTPVLEVRLPWATHSWETTNGSLHED